MYFEKKSKKYVSEDKLFKTEYFNIHLIEKQNMYKIIAHLYITLIIKKIYCLNKMYSYIFEISFNIPILEKLNDLYKSKCLTFSNKIMKNIFFSFTSL